MSYASFLAAPFLFPLALNNPLIYWNGTTGGPAFASITADAANEKIALVGRVYWEGAPTSAKTIGSSSKIKIRTAGITFANAATNLRVGVQDVLTTGVTTPQPDGTFDVYADFAGDSGTPLNSGSDFSFVEFNLSTGSKSVAHGDLIAVVFDMTARGGTDSVTVAGCLGSNSKLFPVMTGYVPSSWSVAQGVPVCAITADDGTVGTFYGGTDFSAVSAVAINSTDSPDEHGTIFQVPFKCKVGGLFMIGSTTDTNSDFDLKLYATPLGTPSALATISVPGSQGNAVITEGPGIYMLAQEVELQPGVDYCVAVAATGSTDVTLSRLTLMPEIQDLFGHENCREGSRTNGSGAFSETTGQVIQTGILISAIDDGTGFGRASFNLGV